MYLYIETAFVGRQIIKMPSNQHKESHYKGKTILRPSYLFNGNMCTKRDSLYIETLPWKPYSMWIT